MTHYNVTNLKVKPGQLVADGKAVAPGAAASQVIKSPGAPLTASEAAAVRSVEPYRDQLLKWADWYASMGWVVIGIDVRGDKKPIGQWGHLRAEAAAGNVARIEDALTGRKAENVGLAVLCGQSGLVAIDVDCKPHHKCSISRDIVGHGVWDACIVKDDPKASKANLDALFGRNVLSSAQKQLLWKQRLAALLVLAAKGNADTQRRLLAAVNATFGAVSQSGGRHFLFTLPPGAKIGQSISRYVAGIDIKAGYPDQDGNIHSGGYVLVSPTVGKKGSYRWVDPNVIPLELPHEFATLFQSIQRKDGSWALASAIRASAASGSTGTFDEAKFGPLTDEIRAARVRAGDASLHGSKAGGPGIFGKLESAVSERNNLLFWCACRVGELIEAEMIRECMIDATVNRLAEIAEDIGLNADEIWPSVNSGLRTGMSRPNVTLAEVGAPKGSAVSAMAMPSVVATGSAVSYAASATVPGSAQDHVDLQPLIDIVQIAINARNTGHDEALFADDVLDAAARIKLADEHGEWAKLRADVKLARKGRISDWESEVNFAAAGLNADAKAAYQAEAWPRLNPNTGKPVAAIENVAHAMKRLGVEVFQDEFASVPRIRTGEKNEFACFSELDDASMRALRIACEGIGLRLKVAEFEDYVLELARRNGEHPVRDYLDSLVWDGRNRVDDWLTEYLGAPGDAYTMAVGKLLLVAAVRRVRQPGVKFDTMVVLEGSQGVGKSTALRILAGNDWFTDAVNLGDDPKIMMEQSSGKWLVEVPEMIGRRNEVERIKAQLSRVSDRARMAFGRGTTERPRQFILVGTTNGGGAGDGYLIDRTGNRRFLPVQVGDIDLKKLAEDRDELWAEAAWLESQGEPITLPKRLWGWAAQEQARRVESLPLEEILAEKVSGLSGFIPLADLYEVAGLDAAQMARASAQQGRIIKSAMEHMGWRPERRTVMAGQPTRARGYANSHAGDCYVAIGGRLTARRGGP